MFAQEAAFGQDAFGDEVGQPGVGAAQFVDGPAHQPRHGGDDGQKDLEIEQRAARQRRREDVVAQRRAADAEKRDEPQREDRAQRVETQHRPDDDRQDHVFARPIGRQRPQVHARHGVAHDQERQQEGSTFAPTGGGEVADGFAPRQDRRRAEDQEARDVAHVPGHEHRGPGAVREQTRQCQARAAASRAQERGQQGDVRDEARRAERGMAELPAVGAVFQGPGGEEGFGGVAQGDAQRTEDQREGGSRGDPGAKGVQVGQGRAQEDGWRVTASAKEERRHRQPGGRPDRARVGLQVGEVKRRARQQEVAAGD